MNHLQRHKVFISYHHENDQWAKDYLCDLNEIYGIFENMSVDDGDISNGLIAETIRTKIRDQYLRNSTVTILLVGLETRNRKHINWELYSSMHDGLRNGKAGILVIELPSISLGNSTICYNEDKNLFPDYSHTGGWFPVNREADYKALHPFLPEIIIDNLVTGTGMFSVVPWAMIENNPSVLLRLIQGAFDRKDEAVYDLSGLMRERNSINTLTTQY